CEWSCPCRSCRGPPVAGVRVVRVAVTDIAVVAEDLLAPVAIRLDLLLGDEAERVPERSHRLGEEIGGPVVPPLATGGARAPRARKVDGGHRDDGITALDLDLDFN